ncbi:MAG: hypothetical protein AAF830_03120 [Pseudomonadota bacterium]
MNWRSPFVVLAVVVIGAVSFGGYLVLSAYAPALRQGKEAAPHALSRSAIGYRALGDLLEGVGIDVVRLRSKPDPSAPSVSVLTPYAGSLRALEIDGRRKTLIILPKWSAGAHPTKQGWAGLLFPSRLEEVSFIIAGEDIALSVTQRGIGDEAEEGDEEEAEPATEVVLNRQDFGVGTLDVGAIEWFQTLSGDPIEPLWTDDQGEVVLARLIVPESDAQVYVLSDPDLVNTQGLSSLERAVAGVELFQSFAGEQAVVFDLTLNGFVRPRNIITLVTQPPLLGVTLASLLMTLLLGLLAFQRFGPPARDMRGFAAGNEALVTATANLLLTNNKAATLGQMYADQLREDLRTNNHSPASGRQENFTAFEDMALEAATSKDLDETLGAARKLFERKRIIENE